MPKGDANFYEHINTRTIAPPNILYKYTTTSTAHLILGTGALRFSSPITFNDPLDAQWDLMWPLHYDGAKSFERALLREALLNPSSWPQDSSPRHREAMANERKRILSCIPSTRESEIQKFIDDSCLSEKDYADYKDQIADMHRRMRVQCMSEADDIILMWSHYAEQHAGVAISFNPTLIENQHRRAIEPVSYVADLPKLIDEKAWLRSIVYGSTSNPSVRIDMRDWALIKHDGWSYEREWRFAWIESKGVSGSFSSYSFPDEAIVEIIFGYRCAPSNIKSICTISKKLYPHVRFYKMSLHANKYALIKNELDIDLI